METGGRHGASGAVRARMSVNATHGVAAGHRRHGKLRDAPRTSFIAASCLAAPADGDKYWFADVFRQ